MRRRKRVLFIAGAIGLLFTVACGPTAEPTATTATQPTATTAAAATATTAGAATATTAAAAPTATKAAGSTAPAAATVGETKVRPIPVLGMPAPNPLAKRGGTYRDLSTAGVPDFGIWDSAVGTTLEVAVPATDSLLDRNEFEPNKADQILGNFAYDFWTDKTGKQWTFKLKEGAKFTDGHDVTCADAEFSLETLRDAHDATGDQLRRSPRGRWLSRVTDISCADNHTLVMKTDGPLPSLPATLAVSTIAINPKHVYEGNLDKQWEEPIAVGMGAFMTDQYAPDEYVKFKRNPNYWNQPYPYLDRYESLNIGSTTAATAAMRVGRGEGGINLPKSVRDQLLAEGKIWQPVKGAADAFTGYQANWTKAPWNDPRFSLAMRCAIDTAKIIQVAYDGEALEGPIVPLPGVPGAPDWGLTEAEWKAIHPCHGPSGDAANMEKRRQIARDLLKEMGFGPDNPARPTSYTSKDDKTFIAVLSDLSAVGIELQYETVTTSQRYEIQTNATKDILQQGFVTSRRDPDHWFYEQYFGTSDRNYGRYSNAEVDALIDKQSRTLDKAERYKVLKDLQIKLLQDNAKVVARHGVNIRTHPIWVKDIYWGEPANSQNTSVKYVRVWIDQDLFKQYGGQ